MDIFAHTLWTNAAARKANEVAEKKGKKFHINVGWAAFWGVFPDFFAFTIPFVITFYKIIIGQDSISRMRSHQGIGSSFDIAHYLYQYSHSLIIWAAVFLIVWAIYKRPRYELLGWVLHILIDIPSHSLAFYPTPFLFPISEYHFPYGVPWGSYWYMVINYTLLLIIWGKIVVRRLVKRKVEKKTEKI